MCVVFYNSVAKYHQLSTLSQDILSAPTAQTLGVVHLGFLQGFCQGPAGAGSPSEQSAVEGSFPVSRAV